MTDEKPILSSLLNVTQQCLRLLTYVHYADKTLATRQSRTTLGSRQPSVFGATFYNQQLGFSTDNQDTATQNCQDQRDTVRGTRS